MPIKIIDQFENTRDGRCDFWNSYDTTYLRIANASVHRYSGQIVITDLTNAMKAGQTCTDFTIDWNRQDGTSSAVHNLLNSCDFDFRKVIDHLAAMPWVMGKWQYEPCTLSAPVVAFPSLVDFAKSKLTPGIAAQVTTDSQAESFRLQWEKERAAHRSQSETVTIHNRHRPGPRTFSPFVKLNPLKELPKKWTIPHVLRALLNGQFRNLKCNYVYTDDYAHDAAVNFQQGDFSEHAAAFVRRILENPSGWWASGNADSVSICCHHFDSNSFVPVLNPEPKTNDPKDDMRFNPLKPTAAAKAPRPTPLPKGAIPTPAPVSHTPTLKENEARDGFEMHFPTKPSEATLALFRATRDLPTDERWHWHFRGHFWYARRNDKTRAFAAQIIASASVSAVASVPPSEPVQPNPPTATPSVEAAAPVEPAVPAAPANVVPVQFAPAAPEAPVPVVNTATLPAWRSRLLRTRIAP